ncbi:hypothetical protein PVAG01_10227 [Phlyctema vagabunda]|uniref:PLD phosphodiesterase domain-containing protein n=1 Tax=Phlyctema vagabunda TaxID=108571 RepID=A0ABR4P5E6_9HELO
MISDKLYQLCTNPETVSSVIAKDPTIAPGAAWNSLYHDYSASEKHSKAAAVKANNTEITQEDLQRARECGNWGPTQPSELFLKLYHDALCTLDKNIGHGMVSPPLMGSHGTIPLTIISTVPDIMRHMSNLIVRAEKEVILATNYWISSVAARFITNAMKELSKRAGERGERIVFKMQYDRGSPKQLVENHYNVPQKEYTSKVVALPAPEDIPYIDLEVINYHRPLLGTFHCKYMVVDRKHAVLQSNNIQDNDNLEMMTHLEGPIVDSMYDMALLSWHKTLTPPLPSHNTPAAQGGVDLNTNTDQFEANNGAPNNGPNAIQSGQDASGAYSYKPRHDNQPAFRTHTDKKNDTSTSVGPNTTESVLHPVENSSTRRVNSVTQHPDPAQLGSDPGTENRNPGVTAENEKLTKIEILKENATAAAVAGDFEHVPHPNDHPKGHNGITGHGLKPTKEQDESESRDENSLNEIDPYSRTSYENGNPASLNDTPHLDGPDSKAEKFIAEGEQSMPQSQIENPLASGASMPEHTTEDPHYDVDIAGEVARVQAAVSPKTNETRSEAVTRHLNHTTNVGFKGNAPECIPGEEMTPYIPHAIQQPFPMALVNREPYGTPNKASVYSPQNEAWLSGLRNAKKNVFIQSPTLNAEPLIPAIIAACERGIDVYLYICLGYNDSGELLPGQGGTNEMIANKMYTSLSATGRSRLHYFYYIGKDQVAPIVAKKKKRCCHVKVMIIDEHIGIQGNGNQDTQSWYHSQEINVMFDNSPVCRAWIDGIKRNQNTHLYGEASKDDGIWRDEHGHPSPDTIGIDPGRFAWAKGFMGALARVRGVGDF